MKALRLRLAEAAEQSGVDLLTIERDYVQGYLLHGLAAHPELGRTLVLKGGTALRKVWFGYYRFSEDLDFSIEGVPPDGAALGHAVSQAVQEARAAARLHSPIDFDLELLRQRDPHPRGQLAFMVRARLPWHRHPMVPVKIEITLDEKVLLPAPGRPVTHGYGEPLSVSIRTYCLEEICAEKIRSAMQTRDKLRARGWARPRTRDFYDLWRLVRLEPGRVDWRAVSSILIPKCRLRKVEISSVEEMFDDLLLDDVRKTWSRTMGPFLGDSHDVEAVLGETRARLTSLIRMGC